MFEVDDMESCRSCLYWDMYDIDEEPCKYCYGLSLYTKKETKMNRDLSKFEPPKAEPDGYTKKLFGMTENNRKYDIKMVTRGRCMACGKDLTEGLFFCKECEEIAKKLERKRGIQNTIADVKKCDRCGKYYTIKIGTDTPKIITYGDDEPCGRLINKIDVCHNCMDSFIKWFDECRNKGEYKDE